MIQTKKCFVILFGAMLAALGDVGQAGASMVTISKVVESSAGPWQYQDGGLNTADQYGIHDQGPPTLIGAIDGIDFSAGGSITVAYVSGLVQAGDDFYAAVDADGDKSFLVNDGGGSSGKGFPSRFMDSATYPIYLVELVGTFADDSGAIVGTPFAIGDGPSTFIIPVGATRLQLGVNDDVYFDNRGAFVVNVTGPGLASVPEPSTLAMGATASVLAFCLSRRRRLAA